MSTPYYQDESVTLHLGDSLDVLRTLPDQSVDCCVTSPPYFGLRSYLPDGHPDKAQEHGLEQSPAEYVAGMVAVFAEVRRVLTDDGCLFLNLGDSYSSGTRTTYADTGKAAGRIGSERTPSQMPSKNLLGIPWRVAFALQDDGWILRNDIIWSKPNAMPESVTDRLSTRHEHLFMFSKSPRYWFDLDAIREPHVSTPDREGKNALRGQKAMRPVGPNSGAYSEGGRNPGDVWTIATQPFSGSIRSARPDLGRRDPDASAYGKERIASAGCPQHGSPDLSDSTTSHGGREVAYENRTPGKRDRLAPTPAGDSAPTETTPEQSMPPSSSDSTRRPRESAATPRSTGTRRTDPGPSTTQPCTPSAQTPPGTERIEGSLDFDVPTRNTLESSNDAPERRVAGAQTKPRIPGMCTCSWVDNTASTSHFAVMPPELARRAVVSGCKPGGAVLDPFSGSGTTGLVAQRNGRKYVGIDLSADYLDLSLRTRLQQGVLAFDEDTA